MPGSRSALWYTAIPFALLILSAVFQSLGCRSITVDTAGNLSPLGHLALGLGKAIARKARPQATKAAVLAHFHRRPQPQQNSMN